MSGCNLRITVRPSGEKFTLKVPLTATTEDLKILVATKLNLPTTSVSVFLLINPSGFVEDVKVVDGSEFIAFVNHSVDTLPTYTESVINNLGQVSLNVPPPVCSTTPVPSQTTIPITAPKQISTTTTTNNRPFVAAKDSELGDLTKRFLYINVWDDVRFTVYKQPLSSKPFQMKQEILKNYPSQNIKLISAYTGEEWSDLWGVWRRMTISLLVARPFAKSEPSPDNPFVIDLIFRKKNVVENKKIYLPTLNYTLREFKREVLRLFSFSYILLRMAVREDGLSYKILLDDNALISTLSAPSITIFANNNDELIPAYVNNIEMNINFYFEKTQERVSLTVRSNQTLNDLLLYCDDYSGFKTLVNYEGEFLELLNERQKPLSYHNVLGKNLEIAVIPSGIQFAHVIP